MSLVLSNISHAYGDVSALAGASLTAGEGEIVCLFGPSGCGKTTLLRIAAGLEPLQKGRVEAGGELVAEPGREMRAEKRPIGFVFQDYVLFPHMTVGRNIAFGVSGAAKTIVEDELAAVGLEGFAKRYPHELSGGQQQRVALARAMARRPRALLLDEPFASIDTVLRRRLRADLRRILIGRSAAVVLVTHDPEEALALADRIALMRDGRIIETAAPEDLFHNPQTPEGAGIFPDSQSVRGDICNSVIKTGYGEFPAHNLADGPGVIVFRAGALKAVDDADGGLRVADIRFAGPGWSAYLVGENDERESVVASLSAPPLIGAPMRLEADPAGSFVFPAP